MHLLPITGAFPLLAVIIGLVLCQDDSELMFPRSFEMRTMTITHSSPKITRTKTAWFTTHSPFHSPRTTLSTTRSTHIRAASPADPSNTTILSPSTIHTKPSTRASGKIIGLLIALGAVLVVIFIAVLVICHRRYQKVQQKRIAEWIEVNALPDRSSVVANCGTPAMEQAIFRGLDKKQGEEKGDVCTVEGAKLDMDQRNELPLQSPGKAVMSVGKTSVWDETKE